MELERLESFTWTDSGQLAEVYPAPIVQGGFLLILP